MKRFIIPILAVLALIAFIAVRSAPPPPIYPGVVPYEQLDTRNFELADYPVLRIMPFMARGAPPYLAVDTWSFAINTNNWFLYGFNPLNSTWNLVSSPMTINPTDGYLPYRSSATTFANSQVHQDVNLQTFIETPAAFPVQVQDPVSSDKLSLVSHFPEVLFTVGMANAGLTFVGTEMALTLPANAPFDITTGATTNFSVSNPSGYAGTGAKVLTDNGTYQTASSVITGAISSQLLWTNSPTGGGAAAGSSNIIASLPTGLNGVALINTEDVFAVGENTGQNMVANQSTNLYSIGRLSGSGMAATNAWFVLNLGDETGTSSQVNDSQDVFNIGLTAGSSSVITNSSWFILNLGEDAGTGMSSDASQGVYNIGWSTGDSMELSNAFAIFNYGDFAGRNGISVLQNAQDIFNYGYASGGYQNPINSTNLFNYGNDAGGLQQMTGVNDAYNYGTFSGYMGVGAAIDSEQLYNYGYYAGASLAALVADGTFLNFTNIYNFGPEAGMETKGTNANYIFNFGYRAGEESTLTGMTDLYNYGTDAGFQAAYGTGSGKIFNYGYLAGNSANYTNSFYIYNFLSSAGQNMVAQDSDKVLNFGDHAGADMIVSNVSDVVSIGDLAGNFSKLTNSTHIYNWGYRAGRLLEGSYTNLYLFSNGTPTRQTNEFVFGDSTYLYTFPGEIAWHGTIWTNYPSAPDIEGGTVYGSYTLNSQTNGVMAYAVSYLTNLWADFGTVVSIGYPVLDVMSIAQQGSIDVFSAGYGNIDNATISQSQALFGIGELNMKSATVNASADVYTYGANNLSGATISPAAGLSCLGLENIRLGTLSNVSQIHAVGSRNFYQSYVTNSAQLYGVGDSNWKDSILADSSELYSFGRFCGTNQVGSFTNIFLFGNAAKPTTNSDQVVIAANQTRINSQLVEVAGNVSVTQTNFVSVSVVTNTVYANNVEVTNQIYYGSARVLRSALTPIDAGTQLDFASGIRNWTLSLTGAVSLTTANLLAGKCGNILITNAQATNCAFTFPAWIFIGYKPTYITAGKCARIDLESTSTTDAATYAYYGEQQ